MEYKEFKNISFKKLEDDVISFMYSPKLEIDISIARELISNRLEYFKGRSYFALIDFSNVKSVTKEARDYMNDPEGGLKGILAGAFLSNNAVSTLFINLYLRINKPVVPAKFFTNKDDAINWLKRMKAESQMVLKEG
jgi:hypothetical protein